MAAPTDTFIDPLAGATNGNDHGGAGFVDGSFANATNTLTKIGSFAAATCQAGDKIYLDDNGSGEVTPGLYTISVRTDNDNVVLTADIRSGANDPTDVRCDLHDGTINLAWATTQHCADFTTRDAANGDQFNLRDTASDVQASVLDLTTYGVPTNAAQLVIRGYTTIANDGGIGELDANASNSVFDAAGINYLSFTDMHLHNVAGNILFRAGSHVKLINCEIDTGTTWGLILGDRAKIFHCNIHNIGGIGLTLGDGSQVFFNTLENGANSFTTAINPGIMNVITFNILVLSGASDGIAAQSWATLIMNNSIYAAGAATGQGIKASTFPDTAILNNLVEGFSGVGGIGIESAAGSDLALYGYNQVYDCTAEYSIGGDVVNDIGNNETLLASPFTNAGGGDFTPVAAVLAEGWPSAFLGISTNNYLDPGAAQAEGGGGTGQTGWW